MLKKVKILLHLVHISQVEKIIFMKQMKNFPSVLRTEYIYALLYREDAALAEKYKAKFEKVAKTYPYQTDIQSERALMELAEKQ